ncbi:hypothetical protein LTR28_014081 [Elasticomyces elasticus]|nr:hypothetical protein LTR28_014081 [Elasticomyces elasticus]
MEVLQVLGERSSRLANRKRKHRPDDELTESNIALNKILTRWFEINTPAPKPAQLAPPPGPSLQEFEEVKRKLDAVERQYAEIMTMIRAPPLGRQSALAMLTRHGSRVEGPLDLERSDGSFEQYANAHAHAHASRNLQR